MLQRVSYITSFLFLLTCHLQSQEVSWTKDIAPIIYKHCSSCHHEGAIGGFDLMSYDDVKNLGFQVRNAVLEKEMPPWPADPSYRHFVGEAVLSEDEIESINQWVDQGFFYGDQTEEPAPPVYSPSGSLLDRIDHVLEIEPYELQRDIDEYRWFVIENPFEETIYISAIEVQVGLDQEVHHADLFLDATGTNIELDMQDTLSGFNSSVGFPNNSYYVNAWQPGANIAQYPEGWGIPVEPGTDFVFEIHYGPGGKGKVDNTKMNLKFADPTNTPIREIRAGWLIGQTSPVLIDGPLFIPANQRAVFHQITEPFGQDLSLISICPHMHLLGNSYKVWMETPVGDSIPLIDIPQWDFHWQKYYTFQKMQKFPAGSVFKTEGTYDNTVNNHDNPNFPPIDVGAGFSTTDEMMLTFFIYSNYQEGDEDIILDPELLSTATNNLALPASVILYPNPTSDWLHIQAPNQNEIIEQIIIKDFEGRMIQKNRFSEPFAKMNIEYLNSGIYFTEIKTNRRSYIQKFVVE